MPESKSRGNALLGLLIIVVIVLAVASNMSHADVLVRDVRGPNNRVYRLSGPSQVVQSSAERLAQMRQFAESAAAIQLHPVQSGDGVGAHFRKKATRDLRDRVSEIRSEAAAARRAVKQADLQPEQIKNLLAVLGAYEEFCLQQELRLQS